MDFLTCQFCNQNFFPYECHICKYEDCIPSIMNGTNDCGFQIPLQDYCKLKELSSSHSQLQNPSESFGFINLNYWLYEETGFLQNQPTLPINHTYMNEKTEYNLNCQSNESSYRNYNQEMSQITSLNHISELTNRKVNIPFKYQQTNDKYVNIENQNSVATENNCCKGRNASHYIEFSRKRPELSLEELPRNNSFAVHQQIANKKENACIIALREASGSPSSTVIQFESPVNSKLSKQLCIGNSIDISLETKLNEDSVIHSDCQSFNGDICLKEFIHGSTFNKNILTKDEPIAVEGFSLSKPFKGKQIHGKRNKCTDYEPTVKHLTKSLNEKSTCLECGKQFSTKTHLKLHLVVHSEEKPFICRHCHAGFKRICYLRRHIQCETGEKPFNCAFCGQKFLQQCGLKTHIKTHFKQNLFNAALF